MAASISRRPWYSGNMAADTLYGPPSIRAFLHALPSQPKPTTSSLLGVHARRLVGLQAAQRRVVVDAEDDVDVRVRSQGIGRDLDGLVLQPCAVDRLGDHGIRQHRLEAVREALGAGNRGRQRGQADVQHDGLAAEVLLGVVAGPDADLLARLVVVDGDQGQTTVGRRAFADHRHGLDGLRDGRAGSLLVHRREDQRIRALGQVVVDRSQRLLQIQVGVVDREVDAVVAGARLLRPWSRSGTTRAPGSWSRGRPSQGSSNPPAAPSDRACAPASRCLRGSRRRTTLQRAQRRPAAAWPSPQRSAGSCRRPWCRTRPGCPW